MDRAALVPKKIFHKWKKFTRLALQFDLFRIKIITGSVDDSEPIA